MTEIAISERPLMGLFGSESAYQVLMFLQNYEKGYASEIARTYGTSLNQIQNQLNKFEGLGIFVSRNTGETSGNCFRDIRKSRHNCNAIRWSCILCTHFKRQTLTYAKCVLPGSV